MTTIVATRTAIYADSQCGHTVAFTTPKICRARSAKAKQSYLIGGAGVPDEVQYMTNMVMRHGLDGLWNLNNSPNWPPNILIEADTEIVIITEGGDIYLMDYHFVPIEVEDSFYALGSGSHWAIAAMDFGATPEDAIDYACRRDPYSKAPVRQLTFRD